MISEAFSLEEEKSWWVDSGATRHVCNDQTMFKTYEPSYSMLYMGNHSTAQVKGKGKIDLVFTSGNILTLNDVLHVPDVRNLSSNLISSSSPKVASSLAKAITPVEYEVLEKFRIYKSEVELKCDTRIKCLRTDRGGEYYDPRYFQSTGIVHQVTAPYTPQQNGIAERKNRTLMDMVNSMMLYSGLSSGYWGEALLTACYAQNSKAYRFIVVEPNDLISVNTIIESRDARFDENRFKTIPKAHEISNETVSIEIRITTKGNNDDSFSDHQQVEPRRSTRQRRQRTFGPDFEMYLVEGDRKEAVNDEMDSIIGNNTWILVDSLQH
ncbi:zinc finger, CCHC-type containing protein [Tanacetum coccineum]|uniref:Zinc finger, CCHC-type containing protein n=1 Tax=Tanacetum coccineum TaxID=301880 RepID=A0ABQ4ZKP3_9ASTR